MNKKMNITAAFMVGITIVYFLFKKLLSKETKTEVINPNSGNLINNDSTTTNEVALYYNDTYSKQLNYYRQNCDNGYQSTELPTLTIPANSFSSNLSKADANAKAEASWNTQNTQAKANELGVCTLIPTGYLPPANSELGIVGWLAYGSDMDTIATEIDHNGGEFKFYFYGQNGTYPTGSKNGNGFETTNFPTHSITTLNGYANQRAFVEYFITDKATNQVVLYVKDTIGGFHPNYGNNLRSNNHPDDSNRYLKTGNYTWTFKNIQSPAPIKLLCYEQSEAGNILTKLDEQVPSGQTVTRDFSITDTGSEPNRLFKLNINVQ